MGRNQSLKAVLLGGASAFVLVLAAPSASGSELHDAPRRMSPDAAPVEHQPGVFGADPTYEDRPYDPEAQIQIYGGKRAIDAPRPLVEFLQPIYREGPLREPINVIGRKNLLQPAFAIYGDWRTAVAYADEGNRETARIATDLNLDIDLKLTATERIHAFIEPFQQGNNFMRYEFGGPDRDGFNRVFNLNLTTLFFEGDLGAIYAGLADEYVSWDLPFTFGLVPILFQNGIWAEDAFVGGAFAIPALNSPKLDISNMDITFFGGFDKVTSPAILDRFGQRADHNVNIYGVATFIEAMQGYWEAGFGVLDGKGGLDDLGYYSATVAFSRRYGPWVSNSMRAIWTFGQKAQGRQQTADGFIFLVENSLITHKPSTLIPYFNGWVGFDRPQPLADDTGLLKNTGINFEADALTAFPRLDDTGHNTYGGAIGIQYLFNLDQQIVVEAATVQVMGGRNEPGRAAKGDQYALGIRYQLPITPAWIIRADAMVGWRQADDDIAGARLEFRRKF